MKTITMSPEDKYTLQQIYLAYQTPTDQLRRAPGRLTVIADAFEHATGLRVDPGELLRYMIGRRKHKDWPKLGRNALRLDSPIKSLDKVDVEALLGIYAHLDIPVDEYLYSEGFALKLAAQFTKATGKIIPGWQLVGAMMAKRKSGEWVSSNRTNPPTAKPFSDIDEVVRKQANC